ncbi:MAG: BPL-N domain-containing protein, partial [Candidatus Sulfotelmatobacter sp.]
MHSFNIANRLQRLTIIALSAIIPIAFTVPAAAASHPQVLLFNGTGTIANDVKAVETILSGLGLSYATADSAQLNDMSEGDLRAYKLLIVPGGNSITIGENLHSSTTENIHNAVGAGLHYLGICAGGFFGGYSDHNGLNLTSGVWFNFYADEEKGVHKAAVEVRGSQGETLDQYWQDGP